MAKPVIENEVFEAGLRHDLPRGLDPVRDISGRERGVRSRWLASGEMSGAEWQPQNGVLLGYADGRVIGWNDNRHMLTIAGSRAGKGVSLIIPNLLFYGGSAFVIDPKGENAARTARHRGNGAGRGKPGLDQEVHVLDPFGESQLSDLAAFNPLDALDARSEMVVEDVGVFADALITHPERGERHWTESAQALIRALILVVVSDPRFDGRRNLITVRRLLLLTDKAIDNARIVPGSDEMLSGHNALLRILAGHENFPFSYICNGVGEQIKAMGENERGSVLSTARTQTQWLDSPKMAKVLGHSDFDLADLKRKKMTLYLCLPATRMATHARWLRLMILLALNMMERVKVRLEQPVLYVLDEFPVLGYVEAIEKAAGLMAGFGVKLWPIVQNVGQLKQHYEHSWETFFANAGIVTSFGVGDSETLKVLSNYLGHTHIDEQTTSGASWDSVNKGASMFREDRKPAPLLADHELRLAFGRRKRRLLVFNVEEFPAVLQRFIYHDDKLFEGLFDPDPDHEVAV